MISVITGDTGQMTGIICLILTTGGSHYGPLQSCILRFLIRMSRSGEGWGVCDIMCEVWESGEKVGNVGEMGEKVGKLRVKG